MFKDIFKKLMEQVYYVKVGDMLFNMWIANFLLFLLIFMVAPTFEFGVLLIRVFIINSCIVGLLGLVFSNEYIKIPKLWGRE